MSYGFPWTPLWMWAEPGVVNCYYQTLFYDVPWDRELNGWDYSRPFVRDYRTTQVVEPKPQNQILTDSGRA